MAINKKLIHFKHKENFDSEVAKGNILGSSIVFIQDAKEISTHGTVYKTVNWSVLKKPKLITFSIQSKKNPSEFRTYTAEEGMTWEEFLNSGYDKLSPIIPNVSNFTIVIKSIDNYTDVVMAYSSSIEYIIRDNLDNIQYKTDVLINNMSYTYFGEK